MSRRLKFRGSEGTRALLRAAARRQAEHRRKKQQAEDEALARRFAPILAQLCKPQLGLIRLEWLVSLGFICILLGMLVVGLAMWNKHAAVDSRVRCSNGYVWTEWCGCQPPVHREDC